MVQHLPIDDKVSMTISEVRANLAVSLAGRAAEEVFFGADKITTRAESDIASATRLARYSITTAGLSQKIGMVAVNQAAAFNSRAPLENASEKTAEIVDGEIRAWLDRAYADASKLLRANRETVRRLAEELLAKETLTGEQIKAIVAGPKKKARARGRKDAKSTTKSK